MALGSTQLLNRNEYQDVSWEKGGKGGRCVGLTTLPPSYADCLEIWEPQPAGTLRASNRPVLGLLYLYLSILSYGLDDGLFKPKHVAYFTLYFEYRQCFSPTKCTCYKNTKIFQNSLIKSPF
jgi:hypothetical protein